MAINNVDDLENFLALQLERVAEGDITPAAANASSNLAGKLLTSVKMRLDNDRMCGRQPDVHFLRSNENKKTKLLEQKVRKIDRITGEVQEA